MEVPGAGMSAGSAKTHALLPYPNQQSLTKEKRSSKGIPKTSLDKSLQGMTFAELIDQQRQGWLPTEEETDVPSTSSGITHTGQVPVTGFRVRPVGLRGPADPSHIQGRQAGCQPWL